MLVVALMIWVQTSASATPQRITSFNGTAKGQGTLTVGRDSSKISQVVINLKENGEADITLFTDVQLFVKGQCTASDDPAKGIALKISGGVVDGDATGTGTVVLRPDGKSISSLKSKRNLRLIEELPCSSLLTERVRLTEVNSPNL